MTKDLAAFHDSPIQCMGVWGGNGERNNCLRRPGLDVWIWSESQNSAESGGGDLHLVSSCASGRITRILLADVCGFGTLFAEIAAELRDLLKQNVNTIKQARAIRQMSCRLSEVAERGGFASTAMCTYFAPKRSFTLCNAGHPPPFVYQAADKAWSVFRKTGSTHVPIDATLGVVDPCEYQQFDTTLEVGDVILSYSQALTECRGEDGSIIGMNGLLDRVRQLDPTRPAEMCSALAEGMKNEYKDNLASNDATVLVCQATLTPVSWWDNLLAPFRLLRSVSDATVIR